MFTAERKRAYLAKHPETAQHVAGAHAANAAMGNATANLSVAFATDTAAKTGKSERDVRRNAERGADIDEAALRLVRGTSLDTRSSRKLCDTILCGRHR